MAEIIMTEQVSAYILYFSNLWNKPLFKFYFNILNSI